MANILITMFPEEGHLIPSFQLAKQLRGRGHQVRYLGLPDFEAYVQAQGFEFVPMLHDHFPRGWRNEQVARLGAARGLGFLREVSQAPFYQRLCQDVAAKPGDIEAYLAKNRPDLMIVDGFLAPVALLAARLGLRAALLSININLPQADNYPPVVTNLIPDDTPASRSRARVAWRISGIARSITALLVRFNFEKALRTAMQAQGVPLERLERAALYPRLAPTPEMPELIVCPQAFDFPRPAQERAGVHYIEASIDLERKSAAFPWEKLVSERPLIFCTLGSQSHLYAKSRRFFQAVVDAVAARPDWQLVLAVGEHLDPAAFGRTPENVVIVKWAPHTEILKRAALMINHAGLGTIKECIFFGVPMLVCPITRDQPGYAARVVYHQLGLMGSLRQGKEQLQSAIETILQGEGFKRRALELSEIFQRAEAAERGLQLLETLLREGRVAPLPSEEPEAVRAEGPSAVVLDTLQEPAL